MYLSKYLILTLLLVVVGLSSNNFFVKGNAGFMKPIPRIPCENGEGGNIKGCKIRTACHNKAKIEGDVNPIDINEKYEYAIYQLDAKTNGSVIANTYTVQFFFDQEDTGYQLLTFNQNDMKLNSSVYAVEMDAIVDNAKLMSALKKNDDFNKKNGYVFGTLELTFDARNGCGKTCINLDNCCTFYSCANVRLQKTEPKIKNGITVDVQATLVLTDGKGDERGNTTTNNTPKTLQVPGLVHHEAATDSSGDIKAGGNDDINNQNQETTDDKHGNSSNKLILSISLIFTISSIISLFF